VVDQLGQLYAFDRSRAGAKKSLAQFEKAHSPTRRSHKVLQARRTYESRIRRGRRYESRQFADELLKAAATNNETGTMAMLSTTPTIRLGRLALKKGDTKKADEYLLKAGNTTGSPQLDSFAPNEPRQRTSQSGEKDTVLQYLALPKVLEMAATDSTSGPKSKRRPSPRLGANLFY